ncbi:MAG TPA: phosphate acyltransferase PlsX [candidate division Zixibacteria bacterium]|nr:phosphate acyltransferase PlsX [candidate division Zixibacteria bacterium]
MTPDRTHTIALDVMGSDSGEAGIIAGGLEAARRMGKAVHVIFVGRSETINEILQKETDPPTNVSVVHADEEVPMYVTASDGVRMRDSSIKVGLMLVRRKKADAFVSPGNTGAVMGTALLTLGRIQGVVRPAITSVFPTWTGRPIVVLDVGANADSKPVHLSQFAIMGSVYYGIRFNQEAPRVGLISIGEERSKGNELIFNARRLLKDSSINFVGNIEGRDILSGTVDVAVTDGFTGNILLKFAESIQPMLVKSIQHQIQTNIFSRIGAVLLLPFLKRMRNRFDYAEAGGAPLLGVNGVVIICHGASSSRAIYNAIRVAHDMVDREVVGGIREELETNHFGQINGAKNKGQNNRDGIVHSASDSD